MRFYLLFVAMIGANAVAADDGMRILQARCTACHDLSGPAAASVETLWQRKGPDLFYAGSKYQRPWLVSWLQNPRRLRPAGYHAVDHLTPGEESDVIDEPSLQPHPRLNQSDAETVASALMSMQGNQALITAGDFKGKSISVGFGEMVFDKFNGCLACHEIEPGYGGLSGPEVYSAAQRYQADYLVSYIRNPQAWNPKVPMPNKHVSEANIQKLVGFLIALSKESQDEKN